MPSANNQFGRKYIAAKLVTHNVVDSVMVKAFFPRYATNHPSGTTPNWYYYWKQTPANLEPNVYGGPFCSDTIYGYFWHRGYSEGEPYFHACSLANEVNVSQGYPSWHEGIDCYGEVCLHEHNHYSNWTGWWGNHQYDSLYGDQDHDYIPSVLEPSFGLDSTRGDSDNDGIDDFEEIAYDAMRNWSAGSADSLDWAHPGHQH
jgi:hypothetical protein